MRDRSLWAQPENKLRFSIDGKQYTVHARLTACSSSDRMTSRLTSTTARRSDGPGICRPSQGMGKSKWHGELLSKGNTNRNWAVDLQLFRCSFNTTELSEKFVRYQRVGEPIAEVWIGTRFKAVGRTVRMRNLYVIIHSLSSFYFDWLRVSCFGNRTALFVESVSLWIQI